MSTDASTAMLWALERARLGVNSRGYDALHQEGCWLFPRERAAIWRMILWSRVCPSQQRAQARKDASGPAVDRYRRRLKTFELKLRGLASTALPAEYQAWAVSEVAAIRKAPSRKERLAQAVTEGRRRLPGFQLVEFHLRMELYRPLRWSPAPVVAAGAGSP